MSRRQLFGLSQFVALVIALFMPITPPRFGSRWRPAELLFADPSYVQEVAAYFVLANLMMAVLALALFLMVRIDERRGEADR